MGAVTPLRPASGPVVAITGAGGFVGAACVAEARRQGLPVLALYRNHALPSWLDDPDITPLQADLTQEPSIEALRNALPDGSALLHAAAHLGDEVERLASDTLKATQNVMAATRGRDIRLVMISSLAVYDTDRIAPGSDLTESSPLIPLPDTAFDAPAAYLRSARDAYAGSKRLQEALLTHDDDAEDAWVLRPGAIWGPGRSWHALQGFWASKLFVTIGSAGELPLSYLDHVARIAIEAARTPTEGVSVLNVFDDDRPTRARFLRAHRRCYGWPRLNVTLPFALWLPLIRLLKPLSARLPGLFREPILRARIMPLRFPNTRMRMAFRHEDLDTFEGLIARCAAEDTA